MQVSLLAWVTHTCRWLHGGLTGQRASKQVHPIKPDRRSSQRCWRQLCVSLEILLHQHILLLLHLFFQSLDSIYLFLLHLQRQSKHQLFHYHHEQDKLQEKHFFLQNESIYVLLQLVAKFIKQLEGMHLFQLHLNSFQLSYSLGNQVFPHKPHSHNKQYHFHL